MMNFYLNKNSLTLYEYGGPELSSKLNNKAVVYCKDRIIGVQRSGSKQQTQRTIKRLFIEMLDQKAQR